eukprot:3479950-Pyramimonas_sp.AAC.1
MHLDQRPPAFTRAVPRSRPGADPLGFQGAMPSLWSIGARVATGSPPTSTDKTPLLHYFLR